MKKKRKYSRLFYQYLLSYVIILLLPILFISGFVYHYVLNVLQEEMQTHNLQTLVRARDIIELQLENITSVEHGMFLDNQITVFNLKEDTLEAVKVQQKLQSYVQANPIIYDVAYYQENDDYIITAASSCPKETFFDSRYHYQDKNYGIFLREIKNNNAGFFWGQETVELGSGEKKDLITYIRPVRSGGGGRYLIYFMNASFFTDALPPTEIGGGVWAITDEAGQVIVENGMPDLLENMNVEQTKPKEIQGQVEILGKDYLVSQVSSEPFQWNFLALIPKQLISDKIRHIEFLMTCMCGIVMISGAVGIAFFMEHNYTPIKNLETISNDILKNEKDGNEINHVARVMKYLESQNQRLLMDQEIKNSAVRERFLIKLLSGQYDGKEKIMEVAQKLEITFSKNRYRVVIFYVHHLPSGLDQKIEDLYMETCPKDLEVFVRVQQEMQRILVIFGYQNGEEERIEKLTGDLLEVMQCESNLKGIAAMGSYVETIVDISRSFQEAQEALEYKIILFEQRIIRYEEIALRQNQVVYNTQPRELASYIKNRNIEGLEGYLRSALEEMVWKKGDLKQIQRQCSDFIYTMEKVIHDVNCDFFVEKPMYTDISEVLKYENVKEMMEIIRLISCDIIDHLNELEGTSVLNAMLFYVQEHCFSCDFSTTAMAEEFQMSLSYLSQYFKLHSGKNLSDYVSELKLDQAKKLLKETDEAIKDVAQAVGYYNVNSFNRRFKQMTGYTPGEYRKMENE